MKLNKLPVLIRAEVTAAAKGAPLPAAYCRALVVLQEAVDELSFEKLRQVDTMAETLASYARASQDEQGIKKAKLLKYGYRRASLYLAKQLAAKRKADFIAQGKKRAKTTGRIPGASISAQLSEAGFSDWEQKTLYALNTLPDDEKTALMGTAQIRVCGRGKGVRKATQSDVFYYAFGRASNILGRPFLPACMRWLRDNSARGIAKQLDDSIEIAEAKQRVELTRAWCEEFLKNLPKNVSKAKV